MATLSELEHGRFVNQVFLQISYYYQTYHAFCLVLRGTVSYFQYLNTMCLNELNRIRKLERIRAIFGVFL